MNGIPKVYVATNPDDGETFSFAAFCKVGHRVPKGKALAGMPTCGTMACLCGYDADPSDLRVGTPAEAAAFWSDVAEVARRAVD